MTKRFSMIGMIIFFIFGLLTLSFSQEEKLTITTYYPSPVGVYNDLQANRLAVGDINMSGGLDSGDLPTNNGELLVAGNVGLGATINPAYRLYVEGNVYVNGDIATPWTIIPHYVFEPEYTLLSLGELKKFITKNKHLPHMPSDEQIKKEGVKVFEQNRIMLEKLEEAYLYIIKLEERIAKLEKTLGSK